MKKILALLLVFAMLFSLTACDLVDEVVDTIYDLVDELEEEKDRDRYDDDDDYKGQGLFDDNKPGKADSPSADVDEPETAYPESGRPTVDTPADSAVTDQKEYSRGITIGNTYESRFLNMGIRLPAGWEFYGEDYMRNLNNAAADVLGEDFEKMLQNATIIYEVAAVDETTGVDNMNINLEKLNAYQQANLDVGDNYTALKPSMKSMLETAGYTVNSMNVTTVKVAGKTMDALVTEAELGSLTMQQICFAYICGEYLVNFTVTSFEQYNGAYEMLEFFYTLY